MKKKQKVVLMSAFLIMFICAHSAIGILNKPSSKPEGNTKEEQEEVLDTTYIDPGLFGIEVGEFELKTVIDKPSIEMEDKTKGEEAEILDTTYIDPGLFGIEVGEFEVTTVIKE